MIGLISSADILSIIHRTNMPKSVLNTQTPLSKAQVGARVTFAPDLIAQNFNIWDFEYDNPYVGH